MTAAALTMPAAYLTAPRQIAVRELPLPPLGAGRVRIAVHCAGLCGTDVQVWAGTHPAALPLVPGHEFAGVVAAVGVGVTQFRPGDRVVAEGGWSCGECADCTGGAPHRCRARRLLGRNVDGAFAQYVTVPAAVVYPLPPAVDWLAAQSVVTVATAVHARDRAGAVRNKSVVLLGPGHAGLVLLQVLKLAGAGPVVVLGTRRYRLDLALQLGADAVVDVSSGDAGAAARRHQPEGFDLTVEAAGTPAAFATALSLVRPGGTMLVYGIAQSPVDGFDARAVYDRELTLTGSKGAGGCYGEAVDLLSGGGLRIAPLVSHRLPLAETAQAYGLWESRAEQVLRVVILPGNA